MNDRKQKKKTTRFLFYRVKMNLDDSKRIAHAALTQGKDLAMAINVADASIALANAITGEIKAGRHMGAL